MAADRISRSGGFPGSYEPGDVAFLLKRVELEPTPLAVKERMIQSGRRHYSEMIGAEEVPDDAYLDLYEAALARNGSRLARDVASLAAHLAARRPGREVVIVSLARAGTPIGVLLLRTLRSHGHRAVHFSVSIVRDRGIDRNALAHVASRHDPADVVFVDGWTGKGAIGTELRRSLADRPFGIEPLLAVVADPAGAADVAAGGDDYLIASGLLNGIVSGLVSRSVLNDRLVEAGDFHACATYPQHAHADRSRSFVDAIAPLAAAALPLDLGGHAGRREELHDACEGMLRELLDRSGTRDRNRVKPGIAEATRALLRRVPEVLLVREPDDPDVAHLLYLARSSGVPIERLRHPGGYRAAVVVRSLGNDA